MTFDWTVTMGSLISALVFIASMIAGYYAMQRDVDHRFTDLKSHTDARASDLAVKTAADFAVMNLRLEKIFEGDIREIRGRTAVLEERHDNLLKDMIERSHKSNDLINTLVLKVDRLERP